jgi:hypothetical protein
MLEPCAEGVASAASIDLLALDASHQVLVIDPDFPDQMRSPKRATVGRDLQLGAMALKVDMETEPSTPDTFDPIGSQQIGFIDMTENLNDPRRVVFVASIAQRITRRGEAHVLEVGVKMEGRAADEDAVRGLAVGVIGLKLG